jgi:hypothetical protein
VAFLLHPREVWGNSPEKFWGMDTWGTVWERTGTEWRQVVAGINEQRFPFDAAWVSPTGRVVGINSMDVYYLE